MRFYCSKCQGIYAGDKSKQLLNSTTNSILGKLCQDNLPKYLKSLVCFPFFEYYNKHFEFNTFLISHKSHTLFSDHLQSKVVLDLSTNERLSTLFGFWFIWFDVPLKLILINVVLCLFPCQNKFSTFFWRILLSDQLFEIIVKISYRFSGKNEPI